MMRLVAWPRRGTSYEAEQQLIRNQSAMEYTIIRPGRYDTTPPAAAEQPRNSNEFLALMIVRRTFSCHQGGCRCSWSQKKPTCAVVALRENDSGMIDCLLASLLFFYFFRTMRSKMDMTKQISTSNSNSSFLGFGNEHYAAAAATAAPDWQWRRLGNKKKGHNSSSRFSLGCCLSLSNTPPRAADGAPPSSSV
jgi:hypothetical protein